MRPSFITYKLSKKMVCQSVICCCFLVFSAMPIFIFCLKNVHLEIKPAIVRRGDDVTLICTYDLEGGNLYNVKFYRKNYKFYTYTPKENPTVRIFPMENMQIDLKHSNENQVVLKNTDVNVSERFTCEVSTDAPNFWTIIVHARMFVVVPPSDAPKITTENTSYIVGETLKAKCKSGPAKPAVNLTVSLNNMTVCHPCEAKKYASGEHFFTETLLTIPLLPKYFNDSQLKLTCSARMLDVYKNDTEIILWTKLVTAAALSATMTAPNLLLFAILIIN